MMDARWPLSILIALGALAAALVFDAVSRLDNSTALARVAAQSSAGQESLLDRAENEARGGFTHATRWHAGAAEAASWAAGLNALDGDAAAARRAADDAALALALQPTQAVSWMRLAALADSGVVTGACDNARACLERSWQSARAMEPEPACSRILMSVAAGMMPDDDDPRFDGFVQSLRWRGNAKTCFVKLPPQRAFRLLVRLHDMGVD